jgi:Trk K+ transport system NAD-binding subunit
LTVREVAPEVPIVGTVAEEDSIDILDLSGCTHVVPLHQRLGERLAARVNAGHAQTHRIGNIRTLQIADFAVHNTPLVGRTLGALKLQESTGVNVIAVWQRGRLLPARPEIPLANDSVAVVAGTAEQMLELDLLLVIYATNYHPALVIGGGKVGQATARALKQKEIAVHLVERDESLRGKLGNIADQIFIGDAADREVLMKAGLREAPSVLLTTNDDAMNIYLAVYCRRLNPELRIISRITHQKNIEAIYRAGADFAISYASLGVEEVFAQLHSRELLILGEGFELFSVLVPPSLADKTIAESKIAYRTELSVIGMQHNGRVLTDPPASTRLTEGSELFMMGGTRGRQAFVEAFGKRQ